MSQQSYSELCKVAELYLNTGITLVADDISLASLLDIQVGEGENTFLSEVLS